MDIVIWFVVIGAIIIWAIVSLEKQEEQRAMDESHIKECVQEHFDALLSRRNELIKEDSYGNLDCSKWWKELRVFVKNIIFPNKVFDDILDDKYLVDTINYIHQYLFTLAKERQGQTSEDNKKRKKIDEPHIKKCVQEHFDVLLSRRNELIKEDEYGNFDCDKWWEELIFFVKNVVFPHESLNTTYLIDTTNYIHQYLFKLAQERAKELEKEIKKLETDIKNNITHHFETLKIKYKQAIYYDDYGAEVLDGWRKELEYFIQNVIFPQSKITPDNLANMVAYAHQCFCDLALKKPDVKQNISIKTGVDYEHYIEQLLKNANFEVSRTPTTGDQGVDLIAIKNNQRIAIQCKYYSKPVGNKAVQEVTAGKDFYDCQFACVVSNKSFTPAARKLASSLDISLLNEDNIVDSLDSLCK